jgi:hypothetical protein
VLAPSVGGVHGEVDAIAHRMSALSAAQIQSATST